ncbi:hypothetical protein EJB05_12024, partial [Eragrostis curvula]
MEAMLQHLQMEQQPDVWAYIWGSPTYTAKQRKIYFERNQPPYLGLNRLKPSFSQETPGTSFGYEVA